MLRAYVSPHHDDWEQHLTAVEFAYNNSVQASTGYTPFYLMYGQNPETPLTLGQGEIADANVKDFVSRLADDLERAQTNIAAAQERQAKYYNQKRRAYEFQAGDKVLLSSSFTNTLPPALAIKGASAKFSARGWGPFEILETMDDGIAVKLKLPPAWKLHPVVHASHVIPWRQSDQFANREPPPPDPDIINDEQHFQVEAFRNHRLRGAKRRLQYLVKWAGYGEEDNTWEFVEDLREDLSPDTFAILVGKYNEEHPQDDPTPAARRSARVKR
jgi:hypothetical protein